jgi:hypothetical protein
MAKAKKTESAAAPKKKGPAPKPAAPAGDPMIDTNLAASVAARQLAAGVPAAAGPAKAETNSFKNFKANLHNPLGGGLSGILDKTAGTGNKKPNMPFNPQAKQVGRNQTFGADVNRSGVPRRTGGG